MSIETNNHLNNNLLLKIKSAYILREIFDYFDEIKLLNIVRYNKILQDKFEKSIKDYRIRNDIIIELIPFKFSKDTDKKFININSEENHYHIYFNDSQNEIKRNYFTKDDDVKK
jgi:hypothetical protein